MLPHAIVVVQPANPEASPRSIILEGRNWLTLGRNPTNDVVLSDLSVSREHARIRVKDRGLFVEDLNSSSGTFFVAGTDAERRIEPGSEVWIEPRAAIRMGPYLVLQSESLGDDVFLSGGALVGKQLSENTAVTTDQDRTTEAASTVRVPHLTYDGDPWKWVLSGALELVNGSRGFLFAMSAGDRLVLRVTAGAEGPVCLSQSFLEKAASRDRPWSIEAGPSMPEDVRTRSLADYTTSVRLTGVPFRARGEELVALAYLEGPSGPGLPLHELAAYARLTAPMLEVAESRDLEARRRKAAERRVDPRGARSPDLERGERSPLIGRNRRFTAAVETIRRAAESDSTVLILGPSGCGKDELAQLLHRESSRAEHPFVVVNAAALPESLVESELFGHDRGAFTGAERTREGAFEEADGGSLFLDEIGDLSPSAQAKVLRVIETGEVVRVGGTRRRVDVRIAAATHRNLATMVHEGTFRQDLYYRLCVIEVNLPSLAERIEDVLDLAIHFLNRFRKPDGTVLDGPSAEVARALTSYPWPGNIRELRNVIERAVVLDRDGMLGLDDLSPDVVGESSGEAVGSTTGDFCVLPWAQARKSFEKFFFEQAMARNKGLVGQTAKDVGVDRRTMTTKVNEHGLKTRS